MWKKQRLKVEPCFMNYIIPILLYCIIVYMLQQDNDSVGLRWTHLMHNSNVHFSFDSGQPNGPARVG